MTTMGGLDSGQWNRLIGFLRENAEGKTVEDLHTMLYQEKVPRLAHAPYPCIEEGLKHAGFKIDDNYKYHKA